MVLADAVGGLMGELPSFVFLSVLALRSSLRFSFLRVSLPFMSPPPATRVAEPGSGTAS